MMCEKLAYNSEQQTVFQAPLFNMSQGKPFKGKDFLLEKNVNSSMMLLTVDCRGGSFFSTCCQAFGRY